MSGRVELPRAESCETCRFWRDSHEKLTDARDGTVGWCRRYPPQLSPDWLSDDYQATDVYTAASQPGTEYCDWCGEYQPTVALPAPPVG